MRGLVMGFGSFGSEKWDWKRGWDMVFGNVIWSEQDVYVGLSGIFDL